MNFALINKLFPLLRGQTQLLLLADAKAGVLSEPTSSAITADLTTAGGITPAEIQELISLITTLLPVILALLGGA